MLPSKISILMPVKNAAKFLEETLQSILAQSNQHWELLAVDDFSDDASFAILQQFAQKDARIKVFKNEQPGILPALQLAFEKCTGAWLTRMDADDVMPENRLQLMGQRLQSAAPKTVVTGQVNYFSEENVSAGYRNYEKWLNETNAAGQQWQQVYRECVVASPNWLMRKSELPDGFENFCYPEDYDLVFYWYRQKFKIECVPEVTLHWREHSARTSRNSQHYQQAAFFDLKIKRFLEIDFRQRPLVLWGAGTKGKLAASILQQHQISFRWMVLNTENAPRSWRGIDIESFDAMEGMHDFQLLLAVHPSAKKRDQIQQYLARLGQKEGENYWFL